MRQPDVAVAHCNKETKGHWLSLAALQNLSFLLVLFGQVMCKQRKLNIYSSTTEGQKGSADTCQDPCQASKDRHTSHSALSCRDVFAFRFRGLTATTKKSPAPSMGYMTGTTGLGTLSGLSMGGFSTPSPAKTHLLSATTMIFSRAILVAALVQAVAAAKEARMSVSANGGITLFQKRSIGGKIDPALLQGQSKLTRSEAVRLRTYDGKYLHSDGKKVWVSTENTAKTEVLLRPVGPERALNALQSGDAVLLETRGGNRLDILGETVNVRPKNYRQDSQTFLVQRQGGDGDLEEGDPSFLVSGTGHVLAVEGGKVLARKPDMDSGEAFLLERAASHEPESQWLVVPNPQGH
eukprot:s499_g4.t1